jgi:acyl-CoA thioester hydrolase
MPEITFTHSFTVLWSDLDATRHMRHTAYFDHAADARTIFLTQNGYPAERFFSRAIMPVLMREEGKFYREVVLGETITYHIILAGMSPEGSRWKVHHNVLKETGKLAAEIIVEGLWMDLNTRKGILPPADLMGMFNHLARSQNFETLKPFFSLGKE